MKTIISTIILFLCVSASQAQENSFVRSYNAIANYDTSKQKWNEWQDADITLAYNYKGTAKVAMFLDQTTPTILHPIGTVKNETTDSGLEYQEMSYIDDVGDKFTLALFTNGVLVISVGNDIFKFNPDDEDFK
jgi:hypothetical protein